MRPSRFDGFRYRFARLFMGRNGADTLYYVFFVLSLISVFLCGLFQESPVLLLLFFCLYTLFFGYALFRLFSRNLTKRRRENEAFRRFFGILFLPFRRLFLRLRDRRTHVFRRCPHCRATLRLLRIPGSHTVRCPKCREAFPVVVKK